MARILVVLGSTREGRMGERVAHMVVKQLKALGAEPTLLDPLECQAPVVVQPLHFMKDQSAAPEWMLRTHEMIKNTQGFVIVSSEYNCGIPPAISNILDYFPPKSYRHKPASIVTYSMGSFGGIRAAMLLRPFLAELGAVALPSTLTIPTVQAAGISPDGEVEGNDRVKESCAKMCKEVIWYVEALGGHADKTGGNPN